MFDDHWYNIVGLAVNVSWYSMGGTHGPIFLGTYYTDHFGMIRLDDIPRGVYLIEYKWNGQIHSENLTVSSCMRDWFYWNELDAKGGDKAISFFHSTEHPMIFPIPSLTECILNSVHGELHQCQ